MTMMQRAPAWSPEHGSVAARPTTRHPNFQQYLEALGLMTMVGISANLMAAPVAGAEPPGNFSGTCKDLHLNAANFSKTAMLTADCRRQDGTYLKAEVNLNDLITNNHGSLQWRRRPGDADFQQSCSGDVLSGTKFTSSCVESAEVRKSTQIDLNEKITNNNGKLTFISNPKSPGNFSGTCKDLRLKATNFSKIATLTANCKTEKGTYVNSEVNLNDLITNNHGSLQWGHPGGADFQQSCSGDALSGSKLTSSCIESVEVKTSTQLDLNEKITNDNGKLTYIGDEKVVVNTGPPPPPPHGPTMADLVGIAAGVDENSAAQNELLDKIVDLGVHRVRVDFPWDLIEGKKGQWNWGRYNDFVAAAARRHVDILGIFGYGVKWANQGVYPPEGDSKAPPDQFQDFADYAKAVVEHFKGKPGAPTAYEIWNEPNAGALNWHEPTCASHPVRGGGRALCPSTGVEHAPRAATGSLGDPGLFGALAVDTINAIKSDKQLGQETPLLAPGGTVFLWEPTNTSGPDFMEKAFKANPQLASLSDAVTLHGYDAYPPSEAPESNGLDLGTTNVSLGTKIAQMKAAFTAAGTSPNKPVWLTEIGWPTVWPVDDDKQARWLIRSIMLAALNGVDRMYIYKMYDGPSGSAEDHFGLVGQDRQAKKAYLAIQRFMQELGSLRVQSQIPTQDPSKPAYDPTNRVYIVQLADGSGPQAWVVWDSSDHIQGVFRWKLPANTSCEGIFLEPCDISNGELVVGPEPVYVVRTPRLTRGPR